MTTSLRERATGTDVATRDEQPASLGQLVERMRPELARALPRHVDADRIARIALTELRKTPQLATTSAESFMGALMTCAQLGLEPGSATGEAYLVPRKNKGRMETTLIVGYQGLAKLFWQHPLAKHLDAQAVLEGDDFDYAYGLDPFLRHKPLLDGAADRPVTHYYAVATLTTGASMFVVLSPQQVKALRGGKVGTSGDIPDPMQWMERKTVLKQLLKLLPKSPELTQALANDETVRTDLSQAAIDAPVTVERVDAAPVAGQVVDDVPAHTYLWGEDSDVCAQCGEPEDADVHGGRS